MYSSRFISSRRPRYFGHAFLLALVGGMVGCGPGRPGTISGRVTFKGAPLPGGTLRFRPVEGGVNTVVAELDDNGSFSVQLPPGEVLVSVDNRHLEAPPQSAPRRLPPKLQAIRDKNGLHGASAAPAAPPPAPQASSSKYVKIPDRYYLLDTSGLKFTVQSGEQTHDIMLEPE